MDNARDRLMALLTEMFQLDQADLDFGIYRVMNHKREEVSTFLRDTLLPTIEATFKTNIFADYSRTQEALKKAEASARELDIEPEQSPKVQELRDRLRELTDPKALEAQVCSDLVTFFRRYYHTGDFVSRRRYKDGVYSVPYQGEEVKLYWANHDQYYIKSSERLSRYAFTLPKTGRRVRFEVVAGATEKDNVKATQEKQRRFVLADPAVRVESNELVVCFAYRIQAGAATAPEGDDPDAEGEGTTGDAPAAPTRSGPSQSECNAATHTLLKAKAPSLGDWGTELFTLDPTEKDPDRTVLARHLDRFTRRNDFDYFIHKDLRGFLRRELDTFIKNELFHLDDIEQQNMRRVEQALAKVRVLRDIAHKLIDFLAQLEDFQKTLWLKKKFVYHTTWCITLDRVPEALWDEVLANEAQRQAWVKLFAIDKIEKTLTQEPGAGPLTKDFLRQNPSLVLDTAHFSVDFTARLLASIDDLDASTTGVLFHAENFQALQLMQARYRGKVDCVFIDPPYNTGGDGFAYKDGYQHSCWLSMMDNRLACARSLMSASAAFFATISDQEQPRLRLLGDVAFGSSNFVANVIWQRKYSPANDARWFSEDHDHVLVYARSKEEWRPVKLDRSEQQNSAYTNPDNDPRGPWKAGDYTSGKTPEERRGLDYEITNPNTGVQVSPGNRVWAYSPEEHAKNVGDGRVWWGADGSNRVPAYKRFLSEVGGIVPRTIWTHKDAGHNQEAVRELQDLFGDVPFSSPKPTALICRTLQVSSDGLVLDFFGGSGTTGHASLLTSRRFILAEVGSHFDTVLKPRILKVIHSDQWKDGVPVSRKGQSALVKVLRLESYEDALENLAPQRAPAQASLLERAPAAWQEKYRLRYMFPTESRGQGSWVDGAAFAHPFQRTFQVSQGDDVQTVTLDFVETFSWLLGMTVSKLDLRGPVKTVLGTLPNNERALVVWRDVDAVDVDALDAWWTASPWCTDPLLDVVYVNGPFGLEAHRPDGVRWRVERTETLFVQRMFEATDEGR
jgi:adenine-specific DNA-methyltransferase